MQKLAKRLSALMVAIMTLSIMLNFVMVAPAKAATIYPQVQYAQEPQLEYTVGDRVQFNLYTPNYGGRVQYRVVLWCDETKSYKDLWTTTPDRYYDKWMPYGNNIFTLGWVINEPGHYRITIYAKRAGVPNNETYLKGFNCDSYMESDSFVVKAKEVPVEEPKPDVASDKIELKSETNSPVINNHFAMSAQAVIGNDYEVKVNVGKAGVRVVFQIDAPDDSMNKDEVKEDISDDNGIASITYKRLYADADYVTAYVAAAPTVRVAQKVYWGVDKILAIEATDTSAALNGNVKSFKVTLKNPITGERMRDRHLRVLLRENIDAKDNASLSTALITNPYSGVKLGTYQRMNNIVNGGLNQETIEIITNDNGEAAFTLTGLNTKATPVVFYDDNWFYRNPDDQGWGGLPDSSQYKAGYAGNLNERWDETELQCEPATVTFNALNYTFEPAAITPYAAIDTTITEIVRVGESYVTRFRLRPGKTYTVTVKDAEGKPYNRGLVNIGINEYIDGVYGTNTNARIVGVGSSASNLAVVPADHPRNLSDDLGFYKIQATTTKDGVISFRIASDKVNDIGTPVIWIDQDNASPLTGERNGILEPADPQKVLDHTIFTESAVNSGLFYAELVNGNLVMNTDENDDVISIDGEAVRFQYRVRNQNGSAFMPVGAQYANLTYTIVNNGNSPVRVFYPVAGAVPLPSVGGQQVTVDGVINPPFQTITIPTHQTKTISFRTASSTGNFIDIVADDEAKVSVTANANIVTETNTAGGWLAPATAVASWVSTTPAASYAPSRNMFSGTVFGYNVAENYMIVVPATDEGTYVYIPYAPGDEYTVSTPQHTTPLAASLVEFEEQISIDDGLTYKYNLTAPDYISLYNADNSSDNASDEAEFITAVKTQEEAAAFTTITQVTTLDIFTGTDAILVGNFTFGNKVFTPTAGMSTYAVAQMIANASPITIGGVAFRVETTNTTGGLRFTGILPNGSPTARDIAGAFIDTSNTGIQLTNVVDNVSTVVTPAVQEEVTITVNNAAAAARTIKVVLVNGIFRNETIVTDILAADAPDVVARKIRDALSWDLFLTNYTISGTGNQVIISNTAAGASDMQVIIQ